jgi:tetratricopeptide (TPR) repeat protein
MPEQVKKTLVLSIYFALTVSTLLVFWQVCNFDFVSYDDNYYVYDNPNIQAGITLKSVKWAFTTGRCSNWHPLTWLSLMLDWQLYGNNAGGYHFTNLLFHIVNALLVFIVLKEMTNAVWQSAFVAILFALHPLHVESVAWVSERKDVLSIFFWILTMWAYTRYCNCAAVSAGTKYYYLSAVVFLALGLMSKPMLVTMPFVLLLLDYWPLGRLTTKRSLLYRLIEKIPLFVLIILSSIITFIVQHKGKAVANIAELPLRLRISNVFISYMQYIIKMIWPVKLAVFYPYSAQNTPIFLVVICTVALFAVTIIILLYSKNHRYLITGWFWYIVTFLPVIGIIQVGAQAMADRYTYITLTGLFIIIAWGLPELMGKWPYQKIALGVSMVLVPTALGICASRQVSYWNNSVALFSHTIEVTQNNYRVHYNLGGTYFSLGRWQDAIDAYKQAIRIKPNYADAHYNLGASYDKLGRWQDAIEAYKQAIRINPVDAGAYSNLGVAYLSLGRWQEAIEACKEAIKIKPYFAGAHNNLGVAYLKMGDKNSALAEYNILKSLNSELANNLFEKINE